MEYISDNPNAEDLEEARKDGDYNECVDYFKCQNNQQLIMFALARLIPSTCNTSDIALFDELNYRCET
jgi:hypothetical protein